MTLERPESHYQCHCEARAGDIKAKDMKETFGKLGRPLMIELKSRSTSQKCLKLL